LYQEQNTIPLFTGGTMRNTINTAITTILTTVMILSGCGENKKPEPEITSTMPGTQKETTDRKTLAAAPATDAGIIIIGLQQDLEPAGLLLSEVQQEQIMKAFDPKTPSDMRGIFSVLRADQKQVLVNKISGWLVESEHPFTQEQVSRYMAIGPGSPDEAPTDILTVEQIQIIMRAARESIRQQQEN
jgi:hypothetical protein